MDFYCSFQSLEITEPLPPCYINLIDFNCDASNLEHYPDSDEIFSINGSDESDINKKNAKVIRRYYFIDYFSFHLLNINVNTEFFIRNYYSPLVYMVCSDFDR